MRKLRTPTSTEVRRAKFGPEGGFRYAQAGNAASAPPTSPVRKRPVQVVRKKASRRVQKPQDLAVYHVLSLIHI